MFSDAVGISFQGLSYHNFIEKRGIKKQIGNLIKNIL